MSSSVTVRGSGRTPTHRSTKRVDASSRKTSGAAARANQASGRAIRDRHCFGHRQGHVLWHELADDQHQIGDDDDDGGDRDRLAVGADQRKRREPVLNSTGERRPAERASKRLRQGHADLHRCQDARGIFGKRKSHARAAPALDGHLLEPPAAGRYQGELRKREEPVEQDQQDHEGDLEEAHRSLRIYILHL